MAAGPLCRGALARTATIVGSLAGALSIVVLPGSAASAASVTAFYVDKTVAGCSDSGPGTSSTPYCTIAKGVSSLTPGVTLYIGNGTYAETVKPPSGSSSDRVTVTSWPGRHPVVGAGVGNGVSLSSKSYVTVSGLVVSESIGAGIQVSGGSFVTLSGNEVMGAGSPVRGETGVGINLKGTTDSLVTGNYLHDNSDSGIYLSSGATRDTVSDNVSTANARGWQRGANGIDVISPGNLVLRNKTFSNEDSGIQFYTGGNNNTAMLNVSYNNGDHGIDDLNVTGGRLIGNTIFHNCTSGINVEGTSGNYVVENNVAVDNAVYPAYAGISCNRRNGNIGIWDSAPPTTTVDHNLVWLSKPGTMYTFGTRFSSLAAMQAATGQEAYGVQADPKFANASAWNLELTAGSPAIDRGDSAAPSESATDILGSPRVDDPGTPNTYATGPRKYDDLGAFEFQSASQPPPPPVSQPPTAALTVTPASGTAPLAVTADASASSDPQGQALTYTFDFGDGTTTGPQAGATATHTYTNAGSYTAKVTTTDTDGLTDIAQQTVTVTTATQPPPPASQPPTYVNRIATKYSGTTHSSGNIAVYRAAGVQAGDLVVLTLHLTGTTATGAITGSDEAGNSYALAESVADGSGNRLAVLSGVAVNPLAAGMHINVSFPSASSYRLVGDEYAGAVAVDQVAAASGSGTTYSSGSTPVTTAPAELAFGAVAITGGTTSPVWGAGWSDLGSYSLGGNYLGRAQQFPTSTGTFSATGTATGTWLAVTVTFRP
ncbi:MAG TPA: right-handed parallel beta-helix repeat-containing protein [Nocardioidaceae bacterium]|nr:right-handed parallel beta-helix repeat-containing protein [Nocardioidaceae bacterium]